MAPGPVAMPCALCTGEGVTQVSGGDATRCPACHGAGAVAVYATPDGTGYECAFCRGVGTCTGKDLRPFPCPACAGCGWAARVART